MTESGLINELVKWWRYEVQYNPVAGYPPECPSTRGWRPSRQHDDLNGALDTDQRGRELEDFGKAVNSLPRMERIALYNLARNRATGAQVWCSASMPVDPEDRARLVARALDMLGVLV